MLSARKEELGLVCARPTLFETDVISFNVATAFLYNKPARERDGFRGPQPHVESSFSLSVRRTPSIPIGPIIPERKELQSLAQMFSRRLPLRKVKDQGRTGRLNFPIAAALFHFTVRDVRRRAELLR